MQFEIKPTTETDRSWIKPLLRQYWGSSRVVSRGRLHQAEMLPGFLAAQQRRNTGLITYRIEGAQCEIVTLNSLVERRGAGKALVEAVRKVAREAGCRRLWVITTNDNLEALHFYQKRGFTLVQVYRNAIAASRRLKPDIPLVADNGIPIRDEIELEMEIRN